MLVLFGLFVLFGLLVLGLVVSLVGNSANEFLVSPTDDKPSSHGDVSGEESSEEYVFFFLLFLIQYKISPEIPSKISEFFWKPGPGLTLLKEL